MSVAEISELVGLIVAGVGLIGTIVGWVKTLITNAREKKLQKYIEELMIEAEQSELSGEKKKEYVLFKLVAYIQEIGGNAEKLIKQASDYIEKCIDFSKKVNSK